jgi:hypothetical protein
VVLGRSRRVGRCHDLAARSLAAGYWNSEPYGTESAIDPLRGRDDFRLLMMELAFPAEPFARVR